MKPYVRTIKQDRRFIIGSREGIWKAKKINNKVYVKVTDAEQLVNDYIAPEGYHTHKNNDQEVIIAWDHEDDENEQLHLFDEMIHEIQMSKYELQQKIDASKQDYKEEITLTKQELRQDMQRIAQWMQQTIQISAESVEKKIYWYRKKIINSHWNNYKATKYQSFSSLIWSFCLDKHTPHKNNHVK
jgi:hypothetical protein